MHSVVSLVLSMRFQEYHNYMLFRDTTISFNVSVLLVKNVMTTLIDAVRNVAAVARVHPKCVLC